MKVQNQKPNGYELRSDGTLTVTYNNVTYEFFEKDDFVLSDRKKIILKHHAVIALAIECNLTVGPPVLLSGQGSDGFIFMREVTLPDGKNFSAIGESNGVDGNLWSEYLQQYPAETADNRAYERAVLGAMGLYGKIYGGSEIPFADGGEKPYKKPETAPVAKAETNGEESNSEKKEAVQSVADAVIVSETQVETAEAPVEAEQEFDADKPRWWNDIGVGTYTDKMLDPATFIVTLGESKGKNWTVKELYDYNYDSCWYFATRSLENSPSEAFDKQVYSCRRAIRTYGLKPRKESA